MRARYARTSERDVTAPDVSAAWSSAIVFSWTSNAALKRLRQCGLPA